MSNSVKKWLENEEVPTDGFPIRRVASPESFLGPLPIQSFKRSPNRRTSTSSSASGSRYGSASDASSRQSSVSTAASTAPSVHGQIPGFAAPLPAAEYYLPCDFAFMGCFVQFLPNDRESWISHSLSHFYDEGPPIESVCIFCDSAASVFKANGQGHHDRVSNWRLRLEHIADHFSRGENSEDMRPDFFVIEYMKVKDLMNKEHFSSVIRFSERPPLKTLVPHHFKTPETIKRERRDNVIVQNNQREDKRRRRKHGGEGNAHTDRPFRR